MKLLTPASKAERKAVAKLMGALESETYPSEFCLGWRSFLDDMNDGGSEYVACVVRDDMKSAVAYFIGSWIEDEGAVYGADLCRDLTITREERNEAFALLFAWADKTIKGKTVVAECRPGSEALVRKCGRILESRYEEGYFPNGETAFLVRLIWEGPNNG